MTTTSFFPAKPFGCYGDGGAIFTDDDGLAAALRSLRVHGQGSDKYDNVRIGINGRLDTLQAAILLEKLAIFPEEIQMRQDVAGRYGALLSTEVCRPVLDARAMSVWAQYTIRCSDRHRLKARLSDQGVPTAIYYARPLHRQTAYARFPTAVGGCPVADMLASDVLSLPMHPYLNEFAQDRVVRAVEMAVVGQARVMRDDRRQQNQVGDSER
jgi:dTDP-4-amino-4,6-dideoxygalactose transaminase